MFCYKRMDRLVWNKEKKEEKMIGELQQAREQLAQRRRTMEEQQRRLEEARAALPETRTQQALRQQYTGLSGLQARQQIETKRQEIQQAQAQVQKGISKIQQAQEQLSYEGAKKKLEELKESTVSKLTRVKDIPVVRVVESTFNQLKNLKEDELIALTASGEIEKIISNTIQDAKVTTTSEFQEDIKKIRKELIVDYLVKAGVPENQIEQATKQVLAGETEITYTKEGYTKEGISALENPLNKLSIESSIKFYENLGLEKSKAEELAKKTFELSHPSYKIQLPSSEEIANKFIPPESVPIQETMKITPPIIEIIPPPSTVTMALPTEKDKPLPLKYLVPFPQLFPFEISERDIEMALQKKEREAGKPTMITSIGYGISKTGISAIKFVEGLLKKPKETFDQSISGLIGAGGKIISGEGFPEIGQMAKTDPLQLVTLIGAEAVLAKGFGEAIPIITKGKVYPVFENEFADILKKTKFEKIEGVGKFITKEEASIFPRELRQIPIIQERNLRIFGMEIPLRPAIGFEEPVARITAELAQSGKTILKVRTKIKPYPYEDIYKNIERLNVGRKIERLSFGLAESKGIEGAIIKQGKTFIRQPEQFLIKLRTSKIRGGLPTTSTELSKTILTKIKQEAPLFQPELRLSLLRDVPIRETELFAAEAKLITLKGIKPYPEMFPRIKLTQELETARRTFKTSSGTILVERPKYLNMEIPTKNIKFVSDLRTKPKDFGLGEVPEYPELPQPPKPKVKTTKNLITLTPQQMGLRIGTEQLTPAIGSLIEEELFKISKTIQRRESGVIGKQFPLLTSRAVKGELEIIEPSLARQVTTTKTEIESVPVSKSIARIETRLQPRLQTRLQQRTETRLQPRTETRLQPRTETRLQPRTETRLQPRLQTRLQQRTETRLQPRIGARPSIIPPAFNIKFPSSIMRKTEGKRKRKLTRLYELQVKRKGKYKPAGLFPKGKAGKLGEEEVRKTLAASFKIIPTKKVTTELDIEWTPSKEIFRSYKIRKGKKIPLVDEFIQRRGKRLGTLFEREAIQKARRRKR